jgi:hypothetical protein
MVLPRLIKKVIGKIVLSRRGRDEHKLLDRWTCANGNE